MAQDSITVVSWGGAYTKSQVEAYHKPFTAKTGINVVSEDYNGGIAEVKAQAMSNVDEIATDAAAEIVAALGGGKVTKTELNKTVADVRA